MSIAGFRARLWESTRRSPSSWAETLPGQRLFSEATEAHREVVCFGANGTGKTWVLCSELVRVLEGRHPRWPRGPISILLCVTGWHSLSARALAKILNSLAPPDLLGQQDLDPRTGNPTGQIRSWYSPQRGFAGSPPRLVVLRGPMRGTMVDLTTLGAGSQHSAGGTYHLVAADEPITPEEWAELTSRGRGVAGCIWYLFTPTMKAPPQDWARELCERGDTALVHVPLTRDNLTLSSGRLIEPWEDVERRIARWPVVERPMRMGLSWEPLIEGAWFREAWSEEAWDDSPKEGGYVVGGVDYSTQATRTRVVVAAWYVSGRRDLSGHVVLDYRSTSSSLDTIASELLNEFERAGIPLDAVDEWVGDRAAIADAGLVRRDNMLFRNAMLAEWRRRGKTTGLPRQLWEIATPKKRSGSSWHVMSLLHTLLNARPKPNLLLMRRCQILGQNFQRWDGRKNSVEKDGLDALGYSYQRAARSLGLWRDGQE